MNTHGLMDFYWLITTGQNLKDQLFSMAKKRDNLMNQAEEQRCHVVDMEVLRKCYDDKVGRLNIPFHN